MSFHCSPPDPPAYSTRWQLKPATPVTTAVILANLVYFIASYLAAGLTLPIDMETLNQFGANNRDLSAQPWRLVTSSFLHTDVIALLTNMWWLAFTGQFAERRLGSRLFLFTYLLCVAGSGWASAWWNPTAVSVGASSAVWGGWGVILGWYACRRTAQRDAELERFFTVVAIATMVELCAASGRPHIDTAAHLGGLATGMLVVLTPWVLIRLKRAAGSMLRCRQPLWRVAIDGTGGGVVFPEPKRRNAVTQNPKSL